MSDEVSATEENTAFDPNLFEIEALVSKRKAGRGYQYCVKCLDFPDTENTWEAAGVVKKTAKELVEAYERGDSAHEQQIASREARAANRAAFKEPEESSNAIAALEGEAKEAAENAIEGRIRRYSTAMASKMLEKFDVRLPMPEVLVHLREMFDFRRMPWGDDEALDT